MSADEYPGSIFLCQMRAIVYIMSPMNSEKLEALPGPTPRTVLEPGAICVLPASFTRHVSKPKDLPFLVRSTL